MGKGDEDEYVEWPDYFSGHIHDDHKFSLEVEHASHYYGRPIPLLRSSMDDSIILNIGGLLFLWFRELQLDGLLLVDPDVPLLQVAHIVAHGDYRSIIVGHVEKVRGQTMRSSAIHLSWAVESLKLGRNRWRELAERGGRVDAELLEEEIIRKRIYG